MGFEHVIWVVFGVLTVISSANGATCPDGWSSHEESCYIFFKETYNWFNVKTVCAELGGNLVEVGNELEHQFLQGLLKQQAVKSPTWIGLQDFAEEGEFVWTNSKTRAHPTFWNHNEPGDSAGEEDCVAVHFTGWQDANCEDNHYHFICERYVTSDSLLAKL